MAFTLDGSPRLARSQSAGPLATVLLWQPQHAYLNCSNLVDLNVGGVVFTTSRATLEDSQPQSMLAALISGRHGQPRRDAKVR